MARKVYLVCFNGHVDDDYGYETFLLGVYDTEEKAEEAVKTLPDKVTSYDDNYCVVECDLNETLKVSENRWHTFTSDTYLGGYAE